MAVNLTKAVQLGVPRVSLEDMGVMLRPHEFPPRGAFYLDHKVFPVLPAASGDVIVFQYEVPTFRSGILRRLAVEPSDPAAMSAIRWSIRRNRTPVQDYQNVPAPIGTIGEPDEVVVEFDRGQFLQIMVRNNDPAFPHDVAVRVVAWFWQTVQTAVG